MQSDRGGAAIQNQSVAGSLGQFADVDAVHLHRAILQDFDKILLVGSRNDASGASGGQRNVNTLTLNVKGLTVHRHRLQHVHLSAGGNTSKLFLLSLRIIIGTQTLTGLDIYLALQSIRQSGHLVLSDRLYAQLLLGRNGELLRNRLDLVGLRAVFDASQLGALGVSHQTLAFNLVHLFVSGSLNGLIHLLGGRIGAQIHRGIIQQNNSVIDLGIDVIVLGIGIHDQVQYVVLGSLRGGGGLSHLKVSVAGGGHSLLNRLCDLRAGHGVGNAVTLQGSSLVGLIALQVLDVLGVTCNSGTQAFDSRGIRGEPLHSALCADAELLTGSSVSGTLDPDFAINHLNGLVVANGNRADLFQRLVGLDGIQGGGLVFHHHQSHTIVIYGAGAADLISSLSGGLSGSLGCKVTAAVQREGSRRSKGNREIQFSKFSHVIAPPLDRDLKGILLVVRLSHIGHIHVVLDPGIAIRALDRHLRELKGAGDLGVHAIDVFYRGDIAQRGGIGKDHPQGVHRDSYVPGVALLGSGVALTGKRADQGGINRAILAVQRTVEAVAVTGDGPLRSLLGTGFDLTSGVLSLQSGVGDRTSSVVGLGSNAVIGALLHGELREGTSRGGDRSAVGISNSQRLHGNASAGIVFILTGVKGSGELGSHLGAYLVSLDLAGRDRNRRLSDLGRQVLREGVGEQACHVLAACGDRNLTTSGGVLAERIGEGHVFGEIDVLGAVIAVHRNPGRAVIDVRSVRKFVVGDSGLNDKNVVLLGGRLSGGQNTVNNSLIGLVAGLHTLVVSGAGTALRKLLIGALTVAPLNDAGVQVHAGLSRLGYDVLIGSPVSRGVTANLNSSLQSFVSHVITSFNYENATGVEPAAFPPSMVVMSVTGPEPPPMGERVLWSVTIYGTQLLPLCTDMMRPTQTYCLIQLLASVKVKKRSRSATGFKFFSPSR
nr:MAG TPA: hypothetical protein [Caudoviricetes sp.]